MLLRSQCVVVLRHHGARSLEGQATIEAVGRVQIQKQSWASQHGRHDHQYVR